VYDYLAQDEMRKQLAAQTNELAEQKNELTTRIEATMAVNGKQTEHITELKDKLAELGCLCSPLVDDAKILGQVLTGCLKHEIKDDKDLYTQYGVYEGTAQDLWCSEGKSHLNNPLPILLIVMEGGFDSTHVKIRITRPGRIPEPCYLYSMWKDDDTDLRDHIDLETSEVSELETDQAQGVSGQHMFQVPMIMDLRKVHRSCRQEARTIKLQMDLNTKALSGTYHSIYPDTSQHDRSERKGTYVLKRTSNVKEFMDKVAVVTVKCQEAETYATNLPATILPTPDLPVTN
jgi:hypothetical protein